MTTMKNMLPALLILALLGIMAVAAASMFAFNNDGAVATINVAGFQEAACINPLTTLTWDPINPGENASTLIYVNSTGTIPATLNLTTSEWSSANAEANVTLTWNLEGKTINPNSILEATLTLAVASDVEDLTTFSFTAIINAEEIPEET